MSAKVLAENLPAGTTVDDIREQFASWGAPVVDVAQAEGGDPDFDLRRRTGRATGHRQTDGGPQW